MKARVLSILAVLLLAALPSVAAGQGPQDERVVKQIVAYPSNIDRDWPIVRKEREQVTDPVTGEVYWSEIIVRRSPPNYRPPLGGLSSCPDDKTTTSRDGFAVTPMSTCNYQYTESKYRKDAHLGGIVAHNKHIADVFCKDGCTVELYRSWQVELWWTRSSTSWTADNAELAWGCNGCIDCPGNTYWSVYRDGPFTPVWRTDTETWAYRYTDNDRPELQPFPAWGIVLAANSESDAYQNGGYVDHMFVQTKWP